MGTGMVKLDNQIKPNNMKATLTFELHKDQHAFDCAVNGVKYYDIIHDMLHHMRNIEKSEDLTAEQYLMLGRIRNWMHSELESEGLASGF
jgi:DNA recombination-dependent growth factor C